MSRIQDLKNKAMGLVYTAIRHGNLTRPDTCSLCDRPAKTISYQHRVGSFFSPQGVPVTKSTIVAHHWKGYEKEVALDVLWICNSCNRLLAGPEYHDGSLSLQELRQIVAESNQPK
jgi:hypothetical protein